MITYKVRGGEKTISKKYESSAQNIELNSSRIIKITAIEGFETIHSINFAHNRLCSMKYIAQLDKMNDLLSLNLTNNNLTTIDEINNLTKLQVLRLGHNSIVAINCLKNLVSLTELDLSYNAIYRIHGLDTLVNLRVLNLKHNNIEKISGLDELIKLHYLDLSENKINKIRGLDKLTNLQTLILAGDPASRFVHKDREMLEKITGLEKLINLCELDLNHNKIVKIEGLSSLVNLQTLILGDNQITTTDGLNELTNLKELYLNHNQITEIEGLNGLTSLETLWMDNNKIKEIPFSIMNLRNLNILSVDFKINPIIERFLNRKRVKDNKTIYNDSQNVHDSDIVQSIRQSIYNIIDKTKKKRIGLILKEIIDDKILDRSTKEQIIEYCHDKTVHSVLNLTFDEVLCSVWNVITEHKEGEEIKKILSTEMRDSMCKCFTGRLSRLINCLNGFDSRVSIKISDKQEILNIIIKIRNKYDDIEKQKEEVIKELLERGYDKNVIDEYIIYLE